MALPHAHPDDVVDLLPAPGAAPAPVSVSLLRTANLQLLRLVLPAGHHMPGHRVPGELTIQCLQGRAEVGTPQGPRALSAGQLVALAGGEPHDVRATEAAVLLVTLLHPTVP
jgi:quercetin dioxygenase-like cupin family protein